MARTVKGSVAFQSASAKFTPFVQADDDATTERLGLLARIPTPDKWERVDIYRVYEEPGFNVRDESSYTYSENIALAESLIMFGWLVRDCPVFSDHETDGLKILAGHLRVRTAKSIIQAAIDKALENVNDPAERERITNRVRDEHRLRYLPMALVHKPGLSDEEERLIMFDQIIRKGLTPSELARAVANLIERHTRDRTKLPSDRAIGVMLGMSKATIQRNRQRFMMPTVWANYLAETAKPPRPYVKFQQRWLHILFNAYLKDQEDGCAPRVEGKYFADAWQALLSDPDTAPESVKGTSGATTSRDREALTLKAGEIETNFSSHDVDPVIKSAIGDTLRFAAGDNVPMSKTVETLGAYVKTLKADLGTAEALVTRLTAERDTLVAELADARQRIITLEIQLSVPTVENETIIPPVVETLPPRTNGKARKSATKPIA